MSYFDVLFIGIGLSMDAFAVSTTNGLIYKPKTPLCLYIAIVFGVFQGIMPLIGFFTASIFAEAITQYTHYIALILLSIIGGKMIYDGLKKHDDTAEEKSITIKLILIQAIATSIDALTVGISFVGIETNIYLSCLLIAVTTIVLCFVGCLIGKKFGNFFKNKAEIIGGIILVLIGIKIFIEAIITQ